MPRAFSGRRLAEARRRRGWTQMQLAVEAGVAMSTVTNLEIGFRGHGASLPVAAKLATALRVPIESLLDDGYVDEAVMVTRSRRTPNPAA